ncbi:MAG TPA: GTP-binding protein [Tepidisphaeraceae bacterium]|jgi:Ni2+-binding GTPase involved in maturation of urease and hydrogenase|nr:GTP-binding protein [Tepidisphaeraceae bacterium]
MTAKARYIMIGGFLGAGKTTAILKLAEYLSAQGSKVGLITNDQSVGLVDTAMLGAHGFPVQEITGGCFCCRFNSLVDAASELSKETRPDVFIAEPVGSCTDLKASVSYPLRRMYGDDFSVAPLSVLIDPIRALRVLGLEQGKAFSPKVTYVYGKQLEEAELIVINKTDLLSADRLATLKDELARRFPKAELFEISARTGSGLKDWFDAIAGADLGSDPTMDIDYELYAEGEALLGWLNCTVSLAGSEPIDGNEFVRQLAGRIHRSLEKEQAEIAHLKMTLSPTEQGNDLAVLNLVRNDHEPEMSHELAESIRAGELILNLRAEADPEQVLHRVVQESIADVMKSYPGWKYTIDHEEHFRPGKPQPTHRFAEA